MIQISRMPHRNIPVGREYDLEGPIFVGRSSRGCGGRRSQTRDTLENCSIAFENMSMIFHQDSCQSIRADDDDSLSRYDFSLRAPSQFDQASFRTRLAKMDSMDSMGFHVHDTTRIAETNIARYEFETSHSMIDEEIDLDECSIWNGSNAEPDEILGCIKTEVEGHKHELHISDDAKIKMLVGTRNPSLSSSLGTHNSVALPKQKQSSKKGRVATWLTGVLHRSGQTDKQSKQELQSVSLQEQNVRRAKMSRTVSDMRRASF